MVKLKLYNEKGEKTGDHEFPFDSKEISEGGLLQSIRVIRARRRRSHPRVKTRGDVAGGGKKPWRQKGTGRARQGSTRAPQWRGGGVVHGPTGLRRGLKVNKKVSRQSLASALLGKIEQGQVIVVNKIPEGIGKTKEILAYFKGFDLPEGRILVLSPSENIRRSVSNLRNVRVVSPLFLNLEHLLAHRFLLIELADFEKLVVAKGSSKL